METVEIEEDGEIREEKMHGSHVYEDKDDDDFRFVL